jgi:hypothetical protein
MRAPVKTSDDPDTVSIYVSKSLLTGRDDKVTKRGQRIPAAHIEALVTGRIRAPLPDPTDPTYIRMVTTSPR